MGSFKTVPYFDELVDDQNDYGYNRDDHGGDIRVGNGLSQVNIGLKNKNKLSRAILLATKVYPYIDELQRTAPPGHGEAEEALDLRGGDVDAGTAGVG